jgi:hypothetical protein
MKFARRKKMESAKQTQSRWLRWFKPAALVALAAAASVFVTGCGNKGGSNNSPAPSVVPVGPYGNCVGCGQSGNLLASALGKFYSTSLGTYEMELGLEFSGMAATSWQQYPGGANPAYAVPMNGNSIYSGQVTATGRLVIGVPTMSCGLQQGTYTVQTVTPGTWGGGGQSFGGLMLLATGPTTVRIYIPSAYILPAVPPATSLIDNRQFPYKLQAGLQLQGAQGLTVCQRLMVY